MSEITVFIIVLKNAFFFRQGHVSMIVLLIDSGADPTLLDGEGKQNTKRIP